MWCTLNDCMMGCVRLCVSACLCMPVWACLCVWVCLCVCVGVPAALGEKKPCQKLQGDTILFTTATYNRLCSFLLGSVTINLKLPPKAIESLV